MKKVLLILITIALAASCIYPYDAELKGTDENIVVLEGEIIVGGVSTMRISTVNSFSGQIYNRETRGVATVEDDQGVVYGDPSIAPSNYASIPMETAPANRKYRFRVGVGGDVYYSDWLQPLEPPVVEDVHIGIMPSDSSNVQVTASIDPGKDASGYVGITYDETWEFHVDYMCRYVLDTKSWRVTERTEDYPNYWCWRSNSLNGVILVNYSQIESGKIVSFPVINFPRINNRNHKKYSINVHAINIPESTYKYLKNLDDISSSNGSLFTPNPGEMPSNLYCESDPDQRVMGYVTASKVGSKRVFMDSRYFTPKEPSTSYLFISEDHKEDYEFGFYPVDLFNLPKGRDGSYVETVYWGPMYCIDCVAAGGTKEKPDFWQ